MKGMSGPGSALYSTRVMFLVKSSFRALFGFALNMVPKVNQTIAGMPRYTLLDRKTAIA